ncbi:glutaminase kidney isoform, mitochondrial-like isoform X2 [Mizuhopecten yessoensis]|uniref:glutaminase n=1 Tax=Mizuhopecten yessoensis TaxID=6573 RepID=A0A210PQV8_MIZYE|nr:glutaminase kidney isoform, mitochondrial-like isoform X2 [Mizuhopecten yessoensis]OWF38844.1 Glutaminase kidney isoform, mitochondrial [Mizuhopecten yessoensis]
MQRTMTLCSCRCLLRQNRQSLLTGAKTFSSKIQRRSGFVLEANQTISRYGHKLLCQRLPCNAVAGIHTETIEPVPVTYDPNDGMVMNVKDFEDKLFNHLADKDDKVSIGKFKSMLHMTGLRDTDPRLSECMQNFANLQNEAGLQDLYDSVRVDRNQFKECINDNIVLISKAFRSQFVIPDFVDFRRRIDRLYRQARTNTRGEVANYIPQLARYSPDYWGVSVCTVDGQRHSIGDINVPFCLQSVSKPLTYSMVLNELGPEIVHQYVGHEPSGHPFNMICLDRNDKPHNPMINSGAIVTCSLVKQEMNSADKFDHTLSMFKKLAGGELMSFNNGVYLSEKETADRNFALGYYMREKKCFPEGTNLKDVLNFYFQLCSVEINCDSGAVLAATLANGGVCPTTGERLLTSQSVRDTLSLMFSCGMYDYSGQFAFKVGLPAKSGVSGCVLMVVPNVMGICMWSPPLDVWGNSCRGTQFCENFIEAFSFHNFDIVRQKKATKNDPRTTKTHSQAFEIVKLLFGAYNGDVTAMRRYALLGVNLNQQDYDGRTALHVAAAEGHINVVGFLLEKCELNSSVKDRWGFTALDEAKRFGHEDVAQMLQLYQKRNGCTSKS